MGDGLNHDLVRGEREVHEAVLVVLAAGVRGALGRGAAAAARDDVGSGPEFVPRLEVVNLPIMIMIMIIALIRTNANTITNSNNYDK